MLKRVEFILEEKWIQTSGEEAQEAAESYRRKSIGTSAYFVEGETLPANWVPDPSALYLTDSDRLLQLLRESGAPAAGFSHAENGSEKFPGVPYILEEPAYADSDSLLKIWQRLHGVPWRILITEHCIVREFRLEDLDAIDALYDEEARRWLEPPSEDREREKAILKAYIDRIYGLYGFGQWAVLDRENGRVIGRMGFSFPTPPEDEALKSDAALGYLLAPSHRHRGLAEEVCRELIKYGFKELGFEVISAEIAPENTASVQLAGRLGFAHAGRIGDKELYLLKKDKQRSGGKTQ